MNELLAQRPHVLLLGFCPEVTGIIHALNKNYGIEPYFYSKKRFPHIPGKLRYKFKQLHFPESEYYILHTLLDFLNDIRARQTAVLIPCTPYFNNLIESHKDIIEASFIVASFGGVTHKPPECEKQEQADELF